MPRANSRVATYFERKPEFERHHARVFIGALSIILRLIICWPLIRTTPSDA
jgi:hypothetical protein